MSTKVAANSQTSVKKRGRGKPFAEGHDPRRNLSGRKPLGMSWREIFDKAGKLTKGELLDLYPVYGKRLTGLPDDVPLRDAVALSAMVTLACEPSPGLLATIIERVDGKVAQPIAFEAMDDGQKREYIRDLLAAGGYILSGPAEAGVQGDAAGSDKPVDAAPADAAPATGEIH